MAADKPDFEVFEELGVSGVVNFIIDVKGTAPLEGPVPGSSGILRIRAAYVANSVRYTTAVRARADIGSSVGRIKFVELDMFLEEGVPLYPVTNNLG